MGRVGDFFSAPFEKLPYREDERRSAVSALFLLFSAIALLAEQAVAGNTPRSPVFILGGAYFLARTRWYKYATLILIFALTFPSYVVALNLENPEPNRILSSFVWVAVPILITSLIYSVRATIAINFFNILALIVLPFLNPGLTFQVISGALGFIVLLFFVLLIVMVQRNRIELDRQAELRESQEKMAKEIAERIRTQEEREVLIRKLEAGNAELTRFNYTISHELKSPIVTIAGYAGSIQKELKTGTITKALNDLQRIENAANKMQETILALLELSRVGRVTDNFEEVDLKGLIEEALENVAGRIGQRQIRINILPNLPVLYADRARLREIFENLIDNAVKYMGNQDAPFIEIGATQKNNEQVIFVQDNGMGVPLKYHSKIFDLFDKLDPASDGTGVGLALIKQIIETHGGRIWVESEGIGKGSKFCFTIPNLDRNRT